MPTSEYDLVAACDGATFRTRAMGPECGVRDHIELTNCWAAYFAIDKDLLEGSKISKGVSAVGGRFIGLDPDPWGFYKVGTMAMQPRDAHDRTLPFREAMKQGDQALRWYVAEYYKGSGWKTEEVMESMMRSDEF